MGSHDLAKAEKHARAHVTGSEGWKLVRADGAGPFVSRLVHRRPDGSLHTWSSRTHRKLRGLRAGIGRVERGISPRPHLWAPSELGWWISVLFMVGSSCFALGALAGLAPDLLGVAFQRVAVVNAVFFTGSLFFTSAAYLQLLEAANADRRAAQARGETPTRPLSWFGWQPGQIGWLSSAIQFAGTLLFNVNTADAMLTGLNWLEGDLLIWTPNVIGCICFLAASWLAVLECCHGVAIWKTQGIAWWIVMVNMLGSIAFGLSAVFSVVLPPSSEVLDLWAANLWTFVGALCFFFGAYLLLPEMARHKRDNAT